MSKTPEDLFKPDKESEKAAAKKFVNSRCIIEIKISDYHHDLFLFNRRIKNGIPDDWVFTIWIVGKILYRTYYIKEIAIWARILRDFCINDLKFLHSITKDAIDLIDELFAKDIELDSDVGKKEYREGIYNIIRRHKKFISKYMITTTIYTKNPEFIDELFKEVGYPITDNITIPESEQLDKFFPEGKYKITGFAIIVSSIYYACLKRAIMYENMPSSQNILEYCIIKAIEGANIDDILDDNGKLIGRYDAYYSEDGIHKFEKLLKKCKDERNYNLVKWRRTNKIV